MPARPVALVVVLAAGASAVAGDWPQFRGPTGGGVAAGDGLPTAWDKEKNVAWKADLPGHGWSGPVVSGDKVFVTTAVSDKQQKPTGGFGGGPGGRGGFPGGPGGFPGRGGGKAPDAVYTFEVYCFGAADGKLLWKQTAAERAPGIPANPTNGYATETPATDGERVYAYFGGIGGVFCYDLAGQPVWKADLGTYPMAMGHGTASSPALDGGRLFVQCDNDQKSFLVALDARTGKELWRTPRAERTSWSSPIIWKTTGRTEVVCAGSPKVRSYDPETGKQLWELAGLSGQIKASPVAGEDLLYVGSGGGFGGFGGGPGRPGGGPPGGGRGGPPGGGGSKPLYAVKAGAAGDVALKAGEKSNAGVAWHATQGGAETPSPLAYDGHLYVLDDRGGLVTCSDAKTGKPLYKERIPGARGFTASPWAYGGKVFALDDGGTTHVLKAGPEFEVLGANKVGEMAWATPAVAGGAVFLRTVDRLYCIRNGTK